jgi:Lon protease-like protein
MTIQRLPIYPSSEVLFPGQVLPLTQEDQQMAHIIRRHQQEQHPMGIVFVEKPWRHTFATVGTQARLINLTERVKYNAQVTLAVGQSRFRILQLHKDHNYMEATIETWPWLENPNPDWALINTVGEYLRRYIEALADSLPPTLFPDAVAPSAATLGVLAAVILQLPPVDKQRLLELPTAQALLRNVLTHLRLYVPMAEKLAQMLPPPPETYENILMN